MGLMGTEIESCEEALLEVLEAQKKSISVEVREARLEKRLTLDELHNIATLLAK